MKNEKETKANLLASAKKEFMEKGYTQASLRNICKNAGVTTGYLSGLQSIQSPSQLPVSHDCRDENYTYFPE